MKFKKGAYVYAQDRDSHIFPKGIGVIVTDNGEAIHRVKLIIDMTEDSDNEEMHAFNIKYDWSYLTSELRYLTEKEKEELMVWLI